MFTDKHFSKMFNTAGMTFHKLKPFSSDKRLASPQAIFGNGDAIRTFSDYEDYPEELAMVAYCNGF